MAGIFYLTFTPTYDTIKREQNLLLSTGRGAARKRA